MKTKKIVFSFLAIIVLGISAAYADGVNSGIQAAAVSLKGYIDSVITLVMAIGGIVGIVGGIRIYNKWSNGDHDINKELMSWGGAAIFLVIAPVVIKAVFGL